ncbi:MAG: hypothetical protein AB1656_27340 [Candidatus Omnitrophota bacterium]
MKQLNFSIISLLLSSIMLFSQYDNTILTHAMPVVPTVRGTDVQRNVIVAPTRKWDLKNYVEVIKSDMADVWGYSDINVTNIYQIAINRNNNSQLVMIITTLIPSVDPGSFFYFYATPYLLIHDIKKGVLDGRLIKLEKTEMSLYTSWSEVIYAKKPFDDRILLEDRSGEIIFASGDNKKYSSGSLSLSPNNALVGGIVYYTYTYGVDDYHTMHTDRYRFPRIWSAVDGKILYGKEERMDTTTQLVIDARFSPDSRFYSVRYLRHVPDLIDTTTFETIPAQGDIAYNSDVRYMVTGRNGLPTLVDLTTMEEIQKYEIQSPMTACAFSPDDKELYIVDSSRTLYIFDAQLPTRIAGWELYE